METEPPRSVREAAVGNPGSDKSGKRPQTRQLSAVDTCRSKIHMAQKRAGEPHGELGRPRCDRDADFLSVNGATVKRLVHRNEIRNGYVDRKSLPFAPALSPPAAIARGRRSPASIPK
jgi:hypothetical protein